MKEKYNQDTSWINTLVTREFFDRVEDARWSMRINRSEFVRRALVDYLAKVSRTAA
jgi:hypothetical protein